MTSPDKTPPDRPGSPERIGLTVEPTAIETALRRAKRTPTPAGAPWTACRAPNQLLVLDGGVGWRACEHALRVLREGGESWRGTWQGSDLRGLRTELAAGRLPNDHCGGCANALASGATTAAPLVHDYGDLPPVAAGERPTQLVLRIPADGELPKTALASLRDLLPTLTALKIVSRGTWPARAAWREALQKAPELPITLTWIADAPPTADLLGGLRVTAIEWRTASADPGAMRAFQSVCAAVGANGRVQFVLRPDTWFWLEETALVAGKVGIATEWTLRDEDGRVPLAAVGAEELALVKNVLASAWDRLGGKAPLAGVADGAILEIVESLRRLLQQRLEADLATTSAPSFVPLALPRFDHPWFTDAARGDWAWTQWLAHSHLGFVEQELRRRAAAGELDDHAATSPGLRALVQRVAHEQRSPESIALLARIYGPKSTRGKRIAADEEFAATHNLKRYGGPWSAALGLQAQPPRRAPLAIGKPRKPRAGAKPDVTVVVPSYRHENYIEDALRSVLAQRHTAFRLLVVDDCSPDATVAKARAIEDPRLEVRVNERNLGLGNSVLAALASIDTPYVALLNSDDLLHPDRLARCCEVLDTRADVNLVTTGLHLIDAEGGELTTANASFVLDGHQVYDWVHWYARATPTAPLDADGLFAALLERNFLATSTNLVCRTDWLRNRAEALRSLKYCLDWQLFLDAANERSLHHLPEPLAAYRLHATNTVWFRGGRRWSFYLEVNRVLAQSLRTRVAAVANVEQRMLLLLRLVSGHVLRNRESDGIALFVNAVIDAVRADAAAERSPRIQAELERLNDAALSTLALRDASASRPSVARQRTTALLGEVARELLPLEHGRAERALAYAESLEGRLKDCWDGRHRLEAEKQGLLQKERDLAQALQTARQEAASAQRTQREATERLQQDLQKQRAAHDENAQRLRLATEQEQAARQRGDAIAKDLEAVREALRVVREQAAILTDVRDLVQKELVGIRTERDRLLARLDESTRAVEASSVQVATLDRDLASVRTQLANATTAGDTLQRELAAAKAARDALQRDLDAAKAARDALQRDLATAQGAAEGLQRDLDAAMAARDALQRDLATSQGAAEGLQRDLGAAKAARDALQRDLATAQGNAEGLRRDLASAHASAAVLQVDLGATKANRDALQRDLAAAREDIQRWRSQHETASAQASSLRANLDQETAQVRSQREAIQRLEQQRETLSATVNAATAEIQRLNRSREYRIGNFFWNKLPLAYMSRHGKKWFNRLVDTKDRISLWFGSRYRKHSAEGVAVVASCWHWPIYSHTFVYQEMIGFTHMGLDVRMFHWADNEASQLQPAFAYLADHRTTIKPVWDNQKKDKEHFEKTKPGRLRALLERIAEVTGKTVEELDKEPHVLRACTFARMAELAGANYIHTYFFYDQTFMAMVAAWLLEIPRGISCYADHMLDDFPFKLVGLQIELASVVVATSARIKQELSQKSGGKFDDRIIVKPNGVDGARFPLVERPARTPKDLFEVVSVSRIEPKKGLVHLAEAVAHLKQRGHSVRAHVIGAHDPHNKGSLEYLQQLEQTIAELGIRDDVVLHGMKMQEEIKPILQRARAFVAPYVELASGDKDGIPTAMLEAMACGLPIVTTDAGSILEVVENGVEALVVAQRDSVAFANALERLVLEPGLEKKMSRAARHRFDRQFDIKVTERPLHARVAQLLAERKVGATP